MLFLESPAGVGFSYCSEQLTDPDTVCSASDESAAAGNLDALRAFLVRFPQYEGRDFFITGESYAGVYVPTFSAAVYESELVAEGKVRSSRDDPRRRRFESAAFKEGLTPPLFAPPKAQLPRLGGRRPVHGRRHAGERVQLLQRLCAEARRD